MKTCHVLSSARTDLDQNSQAGINITNLGEVSESQCDVIKGGFQGKKKTLFQSSADISMNNFILSSSKNYTHG